ncbi:hypothetical protein B0H17DRAFT_1150769 [Mycena rosella]|uniref:Uncharacterized protein n=1 Tax=Mycena rosella TaxID=1033263 RepID=A0AAD7BQJ8_MYCRO|nr:hypothetical protein B0H17DRAFT_1150769 [Mycena rosella]
MSRKNQPDPPAESHLSRNRMVSSRLLDGTNAEAPSSVDQALLHQTQTHRLTATAVLKLINNIDVLSSLLPDRIAAGTEEDEIQRVITTIQGHDEGCRKKGPMLATDFD